MGDKYDPTYWKRREHEEDNEFDDKDETVSVDSVDQERRFGRVISDTSSQVDSELADMLLGLGMGSDKGSERGSLLSGRKDDRLKKDKWFD